MAKICVSFEYKMNDSSGSYTAVCRVGSSDFPGTVGLIDEVSGTLTEEQLAMNPNDLYTALQNVAKARNGIE